MFRDIRLHGYANDQIEFYAITAGTEAYNRYFFNSDQADAQEIRFFSPGNEFIIGHDGISHSGNIRHHTAGAACSGLPTRLGNVLAATAPSAGGRTA